MSSSSSTPSQDPTGTNVGNLNRLTSLLPTNLVGGLQQQQRPAVVAAAAAPLSSETRAVQRSLLGLDRPRNPPEVSTATTTTQQQQHRHRQRSYRRPQRHDETPVGLDQINRDALHRHRATAAAAHNNTTTTSRRRRYQSNTTTDSFQHDDEDHHDRSYRKRGRPDDSQQQHRDRNHNNRSSRMGQQQPSTNQRHSPPDEENRQVQRGFSTERRQPPSRQYRVINSSAGGGDNDSYYQRPADRQRQDWAGRVTPSTTATASSSLSSSSSYHQAHGSSRPTTDRNAFITDRNRTATETSTTSMSYRRSWDAPTPRPTDDKYGNSHAHGGKQSPHRAQNSNDIEDDDDDSFDRQFYLQEDEGHYVQDTNNAQEGGEMGRFLFTNDKIQAREAALERQRQMSGQGGGGGLVTTARHAPMTARQSALQDDQDAWEENRLLSSGAAVRGDRDLNALHEQDATRVTLLVHQVKPPFLDGRVSFSTVREAVPTVKDASSDFAKKAREGSETLRQLRATKEKNAMRQKFWELGGTRMGNAVGVAAAAKTSEEQEQSVRDQTTTHNGELDYKKSMGFAAHMKKQSKGGNGAVSNFALTKSIQQQRQFLPVYTVRDELLNVINENNIVIIVGETGSGTLPLCPASQFGTINFFDADKPLFCINR
jgi:pre-mRNA-splicing factor ATP-dependent RNA helicase DHX38/PRP16